jgi:hypothetical protein
MTDDMTGDPQDEPLDDVDLEAHRDLVLDAVSTLAARLLDLADQHDLLNICKREQIDVAGHPWVITADVYPHEGVKLALRPVEEQLARFIGALMLGAAGQDFYVPIAWLRRQTTQSHLGGPPS